MIAKVSSPTISRYVDSYLLEHVVCDERANFLRFVARLFEEHCGKPIAMSEIKPELVNSWLVAQERSKKLALETIATRRSSLLSLWRAAAETGMVDEPKRIRKIRPPVKIPVAWSMQEVETLLKVAGLLRGRLQVSRISRAHYWTAFIRAMIDTGLRLCDLKRIPSDVRHGQGLFILTQSKTAWPIRCYLQPETLQAIQATFPPERPTVFDVFGGSKSHHLLFRRIVKIAGLNGSTKMLRKTSATYMESMIPGSAMRHLGHKTHGLAYRHYVDPMILAGAERSAVPNVLAGIQLLTPPAPLKKIVPNGPDEVLLSGEAIDALSRSPLERDDLRIVANYLMTIGVPQTVLCTWLGYKRKFLTDLLWGRKRIPPAAAARLREMFGVEGGAA